MSGTGYSTGGHKAVLDPTTSQGGPGPEIEIHCPQSAELGEMVECSFRYSGAVDRVAWSASDGDPKEGSDYKFTTRFDKLGTFAITLEACNTRACTTAAQHVEVVDSFTG